MFAVSNAIAMSPKDLIELSRQDNPPEAQLRAVFNQGIIDFGKTVAFERLRENPSAFFAQIDIEKTREKIENASYTARNRVKDWQITEMNIISRNVSVSKKCLSTS